jgi:hypothetical protein
MIGASSESYRWRSTTMLEIARTEKQIGQTFAGTLNGPELLLASGRNAGFLTPGTILGFVAAPDAPIPAQWRDILYCGPPYISLLESSGPVTPELEAWLDAQRLELDAETRVRARERLRIAWRAPA